MPPDLTPDDVRGRSFDTGLRGYDKAAVESFQEEVAAELTRMHSRISDLEGKLEQLGIDDVGELGAELKKVGSDISSILEEARRTATDLRERAASDAEQWRSEAESEAAELRSSAQTEAEQIRSEAWNQSSQMLEQVTKDFENQIAIAKQDALFIRAESERESLHMTADARREAEDLLRAAKTEAERMTANAQAKAARTLDEARQAAEGAQERARALEARRAELLIELDAARQSIGQLERQIDERREVLEEADTTQEWEDQRTHWSDDDGSVRLVSAQILKEPEPVDPEAFIEEVARLRDGPEPPIAQAEEPATAVVPDQPVEPGSESPEVDLTPAEATVDEPAVEHPEEVAADEGDEPDAGPIDAGERIGELRDAAETVAEQLSEELPKPEAAPEERPPHDEGAVEESGAEADAPDAAAPDAGQESAEEEFAPADAQNGRLDDLFQRLRTTDAQPAVEDVPVTVEEEASDETLEVGATADETPSLAEPIAEAAEAEPDDGAATLSAQAAVEMRDRFLLPIENRALRSVKRRIVDLQNRALEELRIGDGPWSPDRAMFAADLGPDLSKLAQESYVAGHRAAVEMTGQSAASPPATRTRTDATGLVVDGLASALTDAHDRAVAQSSGARQVAAAVSRVFRAWRTDEAERRLRAASYTAYHEGIVAGLAALGSSHAVVIAQGAHAEQCPSVTGAPFDPAAASAMRLPPAHEECPATVVAAR